MSNRQVSFYCRPAGGLVTDWSLYSTELYQSEHMEAANARLSTLRMANCGFFWKMEVPNPTYRYRIMARPRYNSTVDWFSIYRNRVYMTGEEARGVMNRLVMQNDELQFKLQEEEVAD